MSKIAEVIKLLQSDEDLTQREIARRVNCTEGYVSKAKAQLLAREQEKDAEETAKVEKDFNEFIKPVKIEADQDVLTENDSNDVELETFECGACGATWEADKNQYQHSCPECGEEF